MTNCKLPTFSFAFTLPGFSFKLPALPSFSISLHIPCPLD